MRGHEGMPLEARKLLDAAPFDPAGVTALKQVFDEAWASLAPTVDPADVEIASLGLAHAIVAHASVLGTDDLEAVKTAAINALLKRST